MEQTIREIKIKKVELCLKLQDMIQNFEDETGMAITGISIGRLQSFGVEYGKVLINIETYLN